MKQRRQGPIKKKVDFLPNRLNKYSIRKFTVGTASILIGASLLFGIGEEAQAAEKSNNNENNLSQQAKTTLDTQNNINNSSQNIETSEEATKAVSIEEATKAVSIEEATKAVSTEEATKEAS
ncbi:YSIRK-type signal peptide-containing protein, partial [Staphylococcus croceilyticus]